MKFFIELNADEVRQALNGGLCNNATVVSTSPANIVRTKPVRFTAKRIQKKARGPLTTREQAQTIFTNYAVTKNRYQTAKETGIPYHRVVRTLQQGPAHYGLTQRGTIPNICGPKSGPRAKTPVEKVNAVLNMRRDNINKAAICRNTGLAYTTVRRIIANPSHWLNSQQAAA